MEISLGLPWLTPALQNRFIPQMLNLDLLGALDEKKGCYPGQEIIARTQNLGTVKRRMLRYSADLHRAPEAGTAITNDADETVGEVVRAVVADGKMNLLAVTRLSSVGQILNCEADRTVALRAEPLPYQVP
jgi:folate-binding protein YgfZ